MAVRIQIRRDTAANWVSENPTLRAGEIGIETDTLKFKIGNGSTPWNSLTAYANVVPGDLNNTLDGYLEVGDLSVTVAELVEGNLFVPGTDIELTDTYTVTLTSSNATDDRTVTFPDATTTLVGTDTTDTLTNKSISLGSNTVTATLAQLNTAVSDADLVSETGTQTLTNKSISLASNTITGTIAEFNTAVTDADLAPIDSPTFTGTVAGVTKTHVGLGSVDNTSDANKPVSTATQTALDLKAPLASPTFTGTVSGITATMVDLGNVDNTSDANKPVSTATQTALDLKANLASPTFTGTVSGITATMVGLGNVDNTTDANKPVSTATQTALDLKAPLASPTFTGTPTLPTGTIATTQAAGDNSTAVATTAFVGTAVANLVDSSPALLNTLDEIAAAIGDDPNFATTITTSIGLKAPLESPTFTGTVSGITSTMVGLGNVDNTTDANKPVSTATQTALDLKAPKADPTFTGTVSGVTKTHVGLGNVDNTSDASKPVSTATQTALDLKANLASPTFTGTVSGITATMVDLGNVDNTSDANKPVSTATQTALDLKANLASPTFTGTVSGITATMVGLGNVDNTTDANKPVSTATQTALDLKVDESLFDAKGDLLVASADNTPAKLGVGTNGYLLTANSSATNGVEWAAAPVSLPSQTGNNGYYLTTDGTDASWGALVVPIETDTATLTANTATTISTTALSAFTSIEYMVSLKQGSKVRTSKVVMQTDGTSVDMTEFAITETGGTMSGVVVSATTASTDAVLQVTVTDAADTNVTVKFSKVKL